MGRLPNDVRTHLIASGEEENELLGQLLLLDMNTTNNHRQTFSDG